MAQLYPEQALQLTFSKVDVARTSKASTSQPRRDLPGHVRTLSIDIAGFGMVAILEIGANMAIMLIKILGYLIYLS